MSNTVKSKFARFAIVLAPWFLIALICFFEM